MTNHRESLGLRSINFFFFQINNNRICIDWPFVLSAHLYVSENNLFPFPPFFFNLLLRERCLLQDQYLIGVRRPTRESLVFNCSPVKPSRLFFKKRGCFLFYHNTVGGAQTALLWGAVTLTVFRLFFCSVYETHFSSQLFSLCHTASAD